MKFSFGKYKGKPVPVIVLDHPDYISWMKSKGMTDKPEYKFAVEFAKKFDQIPFTNTKCYGEKGCQNVPTYMTLYNGEYNGLTYFFCNQCDPYIWGALPGKLTSVRTFADTYGRKTRSEILNVMLTAKGFTGRRTEKKLKEFFGY